MTKHHANRVARLKMQKDDAEWRALRLVNELMNYCDNYLAIFENHFADKDPTKEDSAAICQIIKFRQKIIEAMANNGFYYRETKKGG